jgi:hypothetical protein
MKPYTIFPVLAFATILSDSENALAISYSHIPFTIPRFCVSQNIPLPAGKSTIIFSSHLLPYTFHHLSFTTHHPATGIEPLRGTRKNPFAAATDSATVTVTATATATVPSTLLPAPDSLLQACRSTNPGLRQKAYASLPEYISQSTNPGEREKLVLQLIRGAAEGELQHINRKRLSDLPPCFFSPEARYELCRLIDTTGPATDRLILLCAHLGMQELLPDFRQKLHASPPPSPQLKHALLLAMARLNDRNALDRLLSYANRMEVSDELVYELVPELLFTRQSEALSFILDLILSDENFCFSPDPSSSRKIPCAFHLMELIAPLVENFPLRLDPDGSIICPSNDEALSITREWIRTNKTAVTFRSFDQLPLSAIL